MKAEARRTKSATTISDYLDPDALCVLIRQHGGAAYVERIDGRDAVVTDQSLAWVRRLCRAEAWVRP